METTRESMGKEANIAFKEFSKNISYCIFNRILGIISLLLIILSCLCLLLCYWLLAGSKYVELVMVDICADLDLLYFQRIANDTIQSVSDIVNGWVGARNFVSKKNIKSEFASMLERHLAPDWANENNEDLSNETSSTNTSISTSTNTSLVKISENTNSNSDEEECNEEECNEEDSSDEEVRNLNSNLINDFDNEVEDVTQQVLAEREENKVVVDLISNEINDNGDDDDNE